MFFSAGLQNRPFRRHPNVYIYKSTSEMKCMRQCVYARYAFAYESHSVKNLQYECGFFFLLYTCSFGRSLFIARSTGRHWHTNYIIETKNPKPNKIIFIYATEKIVWHPHDWVRSTITQFQCIHQLRIFFPFITAVEWNCCEKKNYTWKKKSRNTLADNQCGRW